MNQLSKRLVTVLASSVLGWSGVAAAQSDPAPAATPAPEAAAVAAQPAPEPAPQPAVAEPKAEPKPEPAKEVKKEEKKLEVNQWEVGPVVLSALGELRYRNEYRHSYKFDNDLVGQRSYDFLRIRLGGKLDWGPVSLAIMGADSHEYITPTDKATGNDPVDLQQLYLSVKHPFELPLYLTVGRQEINLGSQMLLQSPGWVNLWRSFDMVRLGADGKKWQVDGFFGRVVVANATKFNESKPTQNFWGFFGTYKTTPLSAELYLYGLHDQPPVKGEDGVAGDSTRYTPGFRLYGSFLEKALSYEAEAAFQFGNKGNDKIQAFALHAHAQYEFAVLLKPRLRLDWNYASGDTNPTDNVAGAFAPLFGSTHARYGLIDFFRWQNMQELSATAGIKPHKMVDFSVAYYAFWLATTKDAWVNSGGTVIRKASDPDNTSSFVGHEFDAVLGFSPFKQLKFEMVYCLFVPQDFAQQAAKAGEKSDKAQGFWFQAQLML